MSVNVQKLRAARYLTIGKDEHFTMYRAFFEEIENPSISRLTSLSFPATFEK